MTVLGIQVRMFLGLLDPDPLVRGADQDSHQHVTDPQHCFVLLLRICFQDLELFIITNQNPLNYNIVEPKVVKI
jgi:hypothetical protein